MAFDRLDANRSLIERLQAEGKTLTEIADALFTSKRIETTAASVSRYLKSIGKPQRSRELSAGELDDLDVASILVELLAEVRGRSDELRAVIETLAGKVSGLGADIGELEKRIAALAMVQGSGVADAHPQSRTMCRRMRLKGIGVAVVLVAAAAMGALLLR